MPRLSTTAAPIALAIMLALAAPSALAATADECYTYYEHECGGSFSPGCVWNSGRQFCEPASPGGSGSDVSSPNFGVYGDRAPFAVTLGNIEASTDISFVDHWNRKNDVVFASVPCNETKGNHVDVTREECLNYYLHNVFELRSDETGKLWNGAMPVFHTSGKSQINVTYGFVKNEAGVEVDGFEWPLHFNVHHAKTSSSYGIAEDAGGCLIQAGSPNSYRYFEPRRHTTAPPTTCTPEQHEIDEAYCASTYPNIINNGGSCISDRRCWLKNDGSESLSPRWVGVKHGCHAAECTVPATRGTKPPSSSLWRDEKAVVRLCKASPAAAGTPGPAGADGKDGAAGPKGERGERGERGEQGEQGERGPAGAGGCIGRMSVCE